MERKETAIGGKRMKNNILNKLVALEEDVSKQYFRSFSWLLLDAFDKKEMSSKRIGQSGKRKKRERTSRNLGIFIVWKIQLILIFTQ